MVFIRNSLFYTVAQNRQWTDNELNFTTDRQFSATLFSSLKICVTNDTGEQLIGFYLVIAFT